MSLFSETNIDHAFLLKYLPTLKYFSETLQDVKIIQLLQKVYLAQITCFWFSWSAGNVYLKLHMLSLFYLVNLIQYIHKLQRRLNRKLFYAVIEPWCTNLHLFILRKLSLDKTKTFLSELGRKVCYRNLLGSVQRILEFYGFKS